MTWRKRTKQEIDKSLMSRDYTGGYEFWPWLLHMRKWYVIGLVLNLIGGWVGGIYSMSPENENPLWLCYGIIGFFGVFAPVLIGYLLRRDYKEGKLGISR